MEKPLVTVLMPVYNAEKFLTEAIESVLQQTFTRFEFLIMDDGSTDRSSEIVRSFNDERIRFLGNPLNRGITTTLNEGIDISRTELIARMDADDICYPERLQKQYEYMSVNPDCALLSSWAQVITEDKKKMRLEKFRSEFYYYNLTFSCWIYHSTVMFRKSSVLDVGKYSVPYSEDYDLFWQISRKYKIYNLPEVLVEYRVHSGSLHMVQRKAEYERFQQLQVIRNIHYYTGLDFEISMNHLESLRHHFEPLSNENSIRSVIRCLSELHFINRRILEAKNVNRDELMIKKAAQSKEEFILTYFFRRLGIFRGIFLLVLTGSFNLLYKLTKSGIAWRLKHK